MNKKVYYIYGTETGEGVIGALINKGGHIGNEQFTGQCPDGVYYIDAQGCIKCTRDANMSSLLKMAGTELNPRINRQQVGMPYYYVDMLDGIVNAQYRFDTESELDDRLYKLGNYFLSRDEAVPFINEITQLFKRRITNE